MYEAYLENIDKRVPRSITHFCLFIDQMHDTLKRAFDEVWSEEILQEFLFVPFTSLGGTLTQRSVANSWVIWQ
jgi:hypothetical protein